MKFTEAYQELQEAFLSKIKFNSTSSKTPGVPSITVFIRGSRYEYTAYPNPKDTKEIHRRLVKMIASMKKSGVPADGAGKKALVWLRVEKNRRRPE